MKRPSNLTIAIAVGGLLLVSSTVYRRHLPYTGMSLAPKQLPAVVMSIENAYIVGLGHDGKLWTVRAKSVELAQNRFIVTLSGITDGRIFDKGKPALKVRAGRIAYNIYARDMQLSNGVQIEGSEGQRITAPGATWNSYTAMLRSTGGVAFESSLGRVTAKTLVVDVRNRQMSMWDIAGTANVKTIQELAGKEEPNAN
jgi:hypothetical protein